MILKVFYSKTAFVVSAINFYGLSKRRKYSERESVREGGIERAMKGESDRHR